MRTKIKTTQKPHKQCEVNKTIIQQQQNHLLRTDSSLSHWGGGLNAFYWRQIFALDYVVTNTLNCLACMEAS